MNLKWKDVTSDYLRQLLLEEGKDVNYIALYFNVLPVDVEHKCRKFGLINSNDIINTLINGQSTGVSKEKTYKELFDEIPLCDIRDMFRVFIKKHKKGKNGNNSEYELENVTMLFDTWLENNYCLLYMLYIACLNWKDEYESLNMNEIALDIYESLGK